MSPETGSSKPGTATGNSGTILIVDDTPESLAFMNEALAGAGYTVLVAMDGEQALNIARLMTPDLILMDGVMPRMDGFETCRALKASPDSEDVPVIFLTGLSDSSDVLKGLEAGGVDYLTKPVNLDEMLARVQVHLSTAKPRAPVVPLKKWDSRRLPVMSTEPCSGQRESPKNCWEAQGLNWQAGNRY